MLGFAQNPVLSTVFFQDLLNNASILNSLLYIDEHAIQYQFAIKEGLFMRMGLFNNNLLHSSLDRDLIGLAAYGNSVYKGQTAFISSSSLTYLSQTGLSFGVNKLLNFNDFKFLLKSTVNLFQSSSFLNIEVNNSSLFTEENAEYLSLVYNYSYAIQTSPQPLAGNGFSGDLLFEMIFPKGNTIIELGVKDIGATFYSNQSFDSGHRIGEFTFSGISLDYAEISTLGGKSIDSETDSLIDLIAPINTENKFIFLQPYRFVLNTSMMVGANDRFRLNMFYIPQYAVEPVFSILYTRYIGNKLNAGINIGNGAFGGLSSGVHLGLNNKKISLSCTLNGLIQLRNGTYAQSGAIINFAYTL